MNADIILGRATAQVAAIHDPRDRMAHYIGILSGEIRRLCHELAQYQPDVGEREIPVPVRLGYAEAVAIFDADADDGALLSVQVNGADVLGALICAALDDCKAAFEAWQDAQRLRDVCDEIDSEVQP